MGLTHRKLLFSLLFSSLFLFAILSSAKAQLDNDEDDTLKGEKIEEDLEEREEKALSHEGYSAEEQRLLKAKAEKFQFQAEVNKLMDIIVNSLYSNREVFLRELISNAADALDKIRFLALTNPSVLGEGEQSHLDIKVRSYPELGALEIIDTGIGMTKQELMTNLGTIAQSGTTEFLEKYMKGGDSGLIGKFGVGFYSAFLVADQVTVTSKSNEDPDQWIWQSKADGAFTITKDPHGNTLGRGTKITLLMNQNSQEYLDPEVLSEIIRKFSEYIDFPIYLWKSHVETRQVLIEDTNVEEPQEGDTEMKVEDEEEDSGPKFETVSETIWGWERVNKNKPLWLRPSKEITDEEYKNFYKTITRDDSDPLTWIHFEVEGDANFKALLYVPSVAPSNLWDPSPTAHHDNIRLYVHRVFITSDFFDVMPNYLRFIKGIVDSDDLPLNVSREQIQQSKILQAIKKKLVRKCISMLQHLYKEDSEKYKQFYEQYSTNIKVGVIEDHSNKERLEKILLFHSSKTDDLTSLDEYISRMKEGQQDIFYIAGESLEQLVQSPLLERLLKNDYEVLYLVDPIDEYMMANFYKYDKHKLVNIAREGVKLDIIDKEKEKALEDEVSELVKYLQKNLASRVEKVVVSSKIVTSPAILVSSTFGYTANMERIIKAQPFSKNEFIYKPRKIMEINPGHPIVKEMQRRLEIDPEDPVLAQTADMLFQSAALASGFSIDEPTEFASLLTDVLGRYLEVDPKAPIEELSLEREPAQPTSSTGAEEEEEIFVEPDHVTHEEL